MKRWVLNSLVAGIFTLSIYSQVTRNTNWPFVVFRMYANVLDKPVYLLEAEEKDGGRIRLKTGSDLSPYSAEEIKQGIEEAERSGQTAALMSAIARLYATNRTISGQSPENLNWLRLFRWTYPDPRNGSALGDSRKLLFELRVQ